MNGRQAARLASKRIEELEHCNRMASADIKDYNRCIDSVIAGQMTFCDWCADQEECTSDQKGTGCGDWMLRDQPQEILTGGNANES